MQEFESKHIVVGTFLQRKERAYDVPETQIARINNIIHLNGKVNYNVREISNLVKERANLISRVYTVTTNVSGLPHLTVSELALIKRIATGKRSVPSDEDKKYLKELFTIGNLLDVHVKWLKTECVFFKWMVNLQMVTMFLSYIPGKTIP